MCVYIFQYLKILVYIVVVVIILDCEIFKVLGFNYSYVVNVYYNVW